MTETELLTDVVWLRIVKKRWLNWFILVEPELSHFLWVTSHSLNLVPLYSQWAKQKVKENYILVCVYVIYWGSELLRNDILPLRPYFMSQAAWTSVRKVFRPQNEHFFQVHVHLSLWSECACCCRFCLAAALPKEGSSAQRVRQSDRLAIFKRLTLVGVSWLLSV